MMTTANAYCHFCGARFAEPLAYPRTCASCRAQIWANPIPVCVALVPIVDGDRTGLLVIRRAIPPGIGKLALVGGFLEEHEDWHVGCAREVREETGIAVEPDEFEPFWFASSAPKPNRVMLFALARERVAASLPRFAADHEASERGVVYGPAGLEDVFAFSTHVEAARRYFARHGIERPHGFTPR
jgi:ADP-ribose pyrophosphatase YjhB (NUDIX family)